MAGWTLLLALPLTKTSRSGRTGPAVRTRSGSQAERKLCVNRSRKKIGDKAKRWDHKKSSIQFHLYWQLS